MTDESTTENAAPGGTSEAVGSVWIATLYYSDAIKEIAFPSEDRLRRFRERRLEITGNDNNITVREVPFLS